jgi:SAM-dependent methyltransferase
MERAPACLRGAPPPWSVCMREPLYDTIGTGYAAVRRRDPRIYARVVEALEGCRTVLDVGAGTGSYEPEDRWVLGVEPSLEMIRQRAPNAAPCMQGFAEHLPFGDGAVDAVTAFLTIHHWSDLERGLSEAARVARRRVVILTWLPSFARALWFTDAYLPEAAALDEPRFPTLEGLERFLGPLSATPVPVPHDCVDGFFGAYWKRPAAYLDPAVRAGISVLHQVDPASLARALAALARDLRSGAWAERFAGLLDLDELDLGYRLVVAERRA